MAAALHALILADLTISGETLSLGLRVGDGEEVRACLQSRSSARPRLVWGAVDGRLIRLRPAAAP